MFKALDAFGAVGADLRAQLPIATVAIRRADELKPLPKQRHKKVQLRRQLPEE